LSFLEFDTVFCFHGGEAEAGPEEVSEIAEKGLEEFKGYEKAEGDLSDRFLRRELPNSRVGLSRFELEAGSSHGSRDDPESGHRHSEQYEIYFVESGSGSFYVGDRKKRYEPGDAFLVKPYRYRRITADEDTVFFAAGAPVDDGVESE
jgi:quercetin dioxygenase-like cupin family protein